MRYRSQHPYSIKEKQMKSEVLSVKEKIGYGMGDAASHFINYQSFPHAIKQLNAKLPFQVGQGCAHC